MKNSIFNAVCKTRYLALLVVLIFTCGNAWGGVRTGWTRVTSVSEITSGGTFIIGWENSANSNTIVPMINKASTLTAVDGSGTSYLYSGTSTTSTGNGTIDMSDKGSGATTNYEFEIVTGSSSGKIAIKVSDGNYLGFYGSSNNNCKRYSSVTTCSSFTPTVGASSPYNVSLANVQYTSRYIKFNNNSTSYRFSNYGSTEKIVLYKKAASCDKTVKLNYDGDASGLNGSFELKAGSASGSTIAEGGTTANCGTGTTSVVVVPTPDTHYHVSSVSATNKTGDISGPDGDGNYTITYTQGSNISSTVTVTFEEDTKHTLTFYNNGIPTGETLEIYDGMSFWDMYDEDNTLEWPILTSSSACHATSRSFAGWTSENIGSTSVHTIDIDLVVDPSTIIEDDLDLNALWGTIPASPTTTFAASGYSKSEPAPLTKTQDNISLYLEAGSIYIGSPNTFTITSGTSHYFSVTASNKVLAKLETTCNSGTNCIRAVSDGNLSSSSKANQTTTDINTYSVWCWAKTSDQIRMQTCAVYCYDNYITACAACAADPTEGSAALKGGFSLSSVGVTATGWAPGTNCAWEDYGFVWGTSANPTVSDNKVPVGNSGTTTTWDGTLMGSFTTSTTYHFRAYGKNGKTGAEYQYSGDATFTPRSVTFNLNGHGESAPSVQIVNNGGKASDPSYSEVVAGWTFGGWYDNSSCTGDAWVFGTNTVSGNNVILYAKWTEKPKYTVTLDAGNGTIGTAGWTNTSGSVYTKTQDNGDASITLPTPTCNCSGWVFQGWSTTSKSNVASFTPDKADGASFVPANDVTYFAVYRQSSAGGTTYNKITSTGDLTTGNYVIKTSSYALQSGDPVWSSTSNYWHMPEMSKSGDESEITNDNASITWTIIKFGDSYAIKNGTKYLGIDADGNITYSTNPHLFSVSYSSGWIFTSKTYTSYQIIYNTWFRAGTSQSTAILLYKQGSDLTGNFYTNPTCSEFTVSKASSPVAGGTVTLTATSGAQGSSVYAYATPNSEYVFKYWEISGTGASIAAPNSRLTEITIGSGNVTITAYYNPRLEITFNTQEGVSTPANIHTDEELPSVDLPDGISSTCWEFAGWTESTSWNDEDAPTTLYPAGTIYNGDATSDFNLYAVYRRVQFEQVYETSEVEADKEYVISMYKDPNEYAINGEIVDGIKASGTNIVSKSREIVAGGKYYYSIFNPADTYIWYLTGSAGAWTLTHGELGVNLSDAEGAVLQTSSANMNITLGTGENEALFSFQDATTATNYLTYSSTKFQIGSTEAFYYLYKKATSIYATTPVEPTYTITFKVSGQSDVEKVITACAGLTDADIPSAPADNTLSSCISGCKFVGWSATALPNATNTKPSGLFKTASAAPYISSDAIFYAVFANASNFEEDVINYSATSSQLGSQSTTSYKDFSLTGSTGAVYQIYSMGTKDQTTYGIKWNNNGYLYCKTAPTSGRKLLSIEVEGADGKTLALFANNTAYSAKATSSDPSVSLGSFDMDFSYEFTDSYQYIGLNGTEGSTTINTITIAYGTYTGYRTSCCDNNVTIGTPSITGGGTVTFSVGGEALSVGDAVETCSEGKTVTVTVTPAAGYQATSISFGGTATQTSVSPAISTPLTTAQTYTISYAKNINGTLVPSVTFEKKTATAWTWTYNSGAIPDPLVLYVGINKQLNVTYEPADLLNDQKNYSVTKESSVAEGGKGYAYYKMRGAAGVSAETNSTVTFTLNGLSQTVNVTVKPQPKVYFVDIVHNETFDPVMPAVETFVANFVQQTPTHADVAEPGTGNSCEKQHLHLIGWIRSDYSKVEDYLNGTGAKPSITELTDAGTDGEGLNYYFEPNADINVEDYNGLTFYAVWAKEVTTP